MSICVALLMWCYMAPVSEHKLSSVPGINMVNVSMPQIGYQQCSPVARPLHMMIITASRGLGVVTRSGNMFDTANFIKILPL
jgi:hypothetical protein